MMRYRMRLGLVEKSKSVSVASGRPSRADGNVFLYVYFYFV